MAACEQASNPVLALHQISTIWARRSPSIVKHRRPEVPGLPHRTGHGIGMDGHEWGNMVLGNKRPLDVGMCFSVEPMIAIYGEFGVRLEDCVYMTEKGPAWFSQPSAAIDQPV